MAFSEGRQMIVGIDPGQKGGIAFLEREVVDAHPMILAGKELDVAAITDLFLHYRSVSLAIVEKCHSMPGQGSVSTFKFGKGYGILLGIVGALAIPVRLVTPQAWKKIILAGTKKDKNAAIEYVRMRYPTVELIPKGCRKPHDGMADAICLAEYGELRI